MRVGAHKGLFKVHGLQGEQVTDMIGEFLKADIYSDSDINFYTPNSLPYDCPQSIRINFVNSVATGYWDILKLSDDALVYVVDNEYQSDFIYPYTALRDHMVFRFALTGNMCIDSDHNQNIALNGPSVSYFSSVKSSANQITYLKGSHHKMITLYVSRKKIWKLLGGKNGDNAILSDSLFNQGESGAAHLSLTPEIHNIIIEVFGTQFFGPLRQIYVSAKINELLCHTIDYIASLSSHSHRNTLKLRDQEKIQQVYEILNRSYCNPPAVDKLAREVGLNRTDLRRYFRMIHGQTITDFCRKKRMAEAKAKLLHSDMNVTQIALHLGYNHVTNFTLAFNKYYGVSPKKFRSRPIGAENANEKIGLVASN